MGTERVGNTEVLQEAAVSIADESVCINKYSIQIENARTREGVTSKDYITHVICAGGGEGITDTCTVCTRVSFSDQLALSFSLDLESCKVTPAGH